MDANNKAMAYAKNKSCELIINAIKDAYIDGYKAGYKDRDNQLPLNFEEYDIEYIDLGLPSGTLWSSDYLKVGKDVAFLSYDEAVKHNIPNREQYEELMLYCKLIFDDNSLKLIGPNGNYIKFYCNYLYMELSLLTVSDRCYTWSNTEVEENKGSCFTCSTNYPNKPIFKIETISKQYRIPVLLVK